MKRFLISILALGVATQVWAEVPKTLTSAQLFDGLSERASYAKFMKFQVTETVQYLPEKDQKKRSYIVFKRGKNVMKVFSDEHVEIFRGNEIKKITEDGDVTVSRRKFGETDFFMESVWKDLIQEDRTYKLVKSDDTKAVYESEKKGKFHRVQLMIGFKPRVILGAVCFDNKGNEVLKLKQEFVETAGYLLPKQMVITERIPPRIGIRGDKKPARRVRHVKTFVYKQVADTVPAASKDKYVAMFRDKL